MLRTSGILLTLTSSLFFTIGCATGPSPSTSTTAVDSTLPGTTHYTVVNFQPGTKELTRDEQSKIRQLTDVAERHGSINEVRILAWADREYTAQGQNVPTGDSKLADERAATVKALLKDDLQQKTVIDNQNVTALSPANSGLNDSKASKALVLITYNTTTTLNKGEHHE